MDYFIDTLDNIHDTPDIYNLNNFNESGNNYYVFNITFNNKGINSVTVNGEDLIHNIQDPEFILKFKDILKGNKKYKEFVKSNYILYIRQQTLKPVFIHRSNESLHGLNDKSLLVGIDLSSLNLYLPSSTRITDYIKITLIPTLMYCTPDKTNYFQNTLPKISIFSKYNEIYAFEIKTKLSTLHHTNFNKKIMFPLNYNGENGEMECHVFSKTKNEELIYVFYITKLILPHGNIVELCTDKPWKHSIDYSKRFDISIESKYKLICASRIMDIRMKLNKILAIKCLDITLDKDDLNMFIDKFGKNYFIKTYNKPF
jgi:hypothetical protein